MKTAKFRAILILMGFAYLFLILASAIVAATTPCHLSFDSWSVLAVIFTVLHYILSWFLFQRYYKSYQAETDDIAIFGMITMNIEEPEKKEETPVIDPIVMKQPIDIKKKSDAPDFGIYSSEEFMMMMAATPPSPDSTR